MTTPIKTAAQRGKSNNAQGARWMSAVVPWLRPVFPGAEIISNNYRADVAGLLDWTVEVKDTMNDERLGEYLDKMQAEQQKRGTRWHVILKKRRRKSTGQGYAVMTMDQWRSIARVLDDPAVQARIKELGC